MIKIDYYIKDNEANFEIQNETIEDRKSVV